MKLSGLKLMRNKGLVLVCAAAVSSVGISAAAVENIRKSNEELKAVQKVVQSAAPAAVKEAAPAAETVGDIDVLEGVVSFKKAGIEEYDMDVSSVDSVLVSAGKKKESEKKAEELDSDTHFTVKLPEDKSTILKPEKGPSSNPGTRSIAGETYTVYDEISGGYVTLNGHELLCRIVFSEISDSWGEEAIKAQAVAAYSYVRYNDEHGYIPQVGLRANYSAKIERCISAVEGQGIYYNGSLIDAVYSASSAGASAPSEKIWGGAYPYLRAVESVYDSKDPNYGVVKTFTKEGLKSIIEKNTGIKLSDNPRNWFEIQSVFSGKYIDLMKLDGKEYISVNGSMQRVTGALMRSTILGTSNLKSTAFDISYDNGVFTFKTYGWGHGVGMSQWGACYYAQAGYSYDQILRHYYVGTTVSVSDVNSKAASRANMTQEELDNETNESQTAKPAAESEQSAQADETAQQPAETQPAVTVPAESQPEQTEQAEQTEPQESAADNESSNSDESTEPKYEGEDMGSDEELSPDSELMPEGEPTESTDQTV